MLILYKLKSCSAWKLCFFRHSSVPSCTFLFPPRPSERACHQQCATFPRFHGKLLRWKHGALSLRRILPWLQWHSDALETMRLAQCQCFWTPLLHIKGVHTGRGSISEDSGYFKYCALLCLTYKVKQRIGVIILGTQVPPFLPASLFGL